MVNIFATLQGGILIYARNSKQLGNEGNDHQHATHTYTHMDILLQICCSCWSKKPIGKKKRHTNTPHLGLTLSQTQIKKSALEIQINHNKQCWKREEKGEKGGDRVVVDQD